MFGYGPSSRPNAHRTRNVPVLHTSLLIVGVSRVLEELIVLLNQRNKYLAGYHSYLPSAYEERWQWSGSARRNRQDENLYRRRRRVYRICSSELARKLASKGRCPCSILNERSAKSGSSSSAVFVTALTMTGDSPEVAAVVAVASSLAVDTLDSSALPWLFD